MGFAFAQPLFDLLARQAEFFIFQNLAGIDIIAVDLGSDFIPAHITGQVTPALLNDQPISLAVAVNGTIQAVTQPWSVPINGRHGSWSAVVPESSFQTGRNTVEVFVVSDVAGQATLARTR